jgi:intein/homing endonuclease
MEQSLINNINHFENSPSPSPSDYVVNQQSIDKFNRFILSPKIYSIQPVVQRFKLKDSTIKELESLTPKFGFNGLGEVVFRRTYSRNNESWKDVVVRVIEGVMSIRKEHFTRNSLHWDDLERQPFAKRMALSMFNMEWLPPGRGLWMMGTDYVYKRGSMALVNCSACDTKDDLVLSMEWMMDCLMNGVGTGFTTNWRGTVKRPNKNNTNEHLVKDSKEGWIRSVIVLMCSYIDSQCYGFNETFPTFNYSLVRLNGEPIKGFGGTASGPDPLIKLHNRIEQYLDNLCDGFIQNKDGTIKTYSHTRLIADIGNAIGACIVAGNVRRCLPESAMVHTQGGLTSIKNISVGDQVLTMEGYEKVTNVFSQGKQKLIKIVTQDGDFKCTSNHRMAVCTSYHKYEWKEASELKAGDRLITSRYVIDGQETNLPEWTYVKPKGSTTCKDIIIPVLDEDMAWLIGLFQGDGYTYPNYKNNGFNSYISIVGGLNEYNIMEKARDQLKRFGNELHVTLEKRNGENSFIVRCQSKQLSWYLDKYVKQANSVIRVPEYIMKAKPSVRLAFIAGVTDADGCIKSRPIQVLTTVYEDFARDIQNLLYSCGIESRLVICSDDWESRQGWQRLYKVNLITKHSQREFDSIPQLFKEMKKTSRSQNSNGFPVNFETIPKTKTKFGLYANKQFNIDAYDRHYTECDYTPVEVIAIIDDVNDEETYDIEVENRHEFFCNGYLTHNSAEICLGDVEDEDFMSLKDYDKNPERGEIAWMSNNSVVLKAHSNYNDFSYIPDIAKRIRDNGEPGLINLTNIQKYGRYGKEMHDDATLVNPCFKGDTLIAVADGRGCVSIQQLSEENKDVPVYSIDQVSKEVSIKWGRNPRITGTNQKLLRIHFNGPNKGEFLDVTPNHKFMTNDGRILEAKDLQKGDSLPKFRKMKNGNKDYVMVFSQGKKLTEHRMVKEFYDKDRFYDTYQEGEYNGCCKTHNVVIHHKDDNKQNNHPDNLEITTASKHNKIHNKEYIGKGNPMYGKKHTEETKDIIRQKVLQRCESDEYRLKLSLARTPEMRKQSSEIMSKVRQVECEKYSQELESKCIENYLDYIRISNTIVKIIRKCENCDIKFYVTWNRREQAYCSKSCANTKKESIEIRKIGQKITFEGKAKDNFHKQAMIYKDLEERLEKIEKTDWENECKNKNIPHRFNRKSTNKWISKGWKEFKEMVIDYNHRVSHIEELDGKHTVYNITVDDNHTLAVVTKSKDNNLNLNGVFTFNCGEILLCNFEICNLSETFPPRCSNKDVFYDAVKYATFYSSTVCLLPNHRPETNAIIAKNRRIGVSISGVAQWASGEVPEGWGSMNYTNMTLFLRKAYKIVRAENKKLAEEAGIPASIRVTTIKPSGSISLLAGVTPGVHYPVSRYAIRRMRIGNDSPLVAIMKKANIPNEPDTYSDNTLVFEFVIDHGNVRPCDKVSPWEQFALVAMMQKCWSDNSVSATVYFDKEKDGNDVEKLLAMHIPLLKSVSMLPYSGHGYAQAPYEPIDKETYLELLSKYKKINFDKVTGNVPDGSKFCNNDTCM